MHMIEDNVKYITKNIFLNWANGLEFGIWLILHQPNRDYI